MSSPVTLTDLPVEVLIEIFQSKELSCEDLYSLYHTCHYLREVITTRSLWLHKLQKVWPSPENDNRPDLDPVDECKNIIKTYKYCREHLLITSPAFFKLFQLSSNGLAFDKYMNRFLFICSMYGGLGKLYLFVFLKDMYIKDIKDQSATPSRLYSVPNRYCASVVLDYLNQHYLKETWSRLRQNRHKWTPERVVFFFGRWMEPELEGFDSCFDNEMTNIVNTIKKSLPKNHPLHSINDKERKVWARNFLSNNKYDSNTCKKIIKLSYEVLNSQGLISTNKPSNATLTIRNVFENKQSNSFYSAIILEAVLRRCGVRIECLFLSEKIHLLWRSNWETDAEIFIINVFSGEIEPSTIYFMNLPHLSLYSPTEILIKLSTCMNDADVKLTETYQRSVKLLKFLEPNNVMHFLMR